MSSMPPPLPTPTLQYATPVAQFVNTQGMWRKRNQLILSRAASLPPLCVKCSEPQAKRYERTVYWHSPFLYLLILPGLLIYAIVALVLRKKATYSCGLCTAHVAQRNRKLLIAWGSVALAVVLLVLSIVTAADAFGRGYGSVAGGLAIVGAVLLLGAGIFAAIALPILRPRLIDEHYAYYQGAGEAFLAPLGEMV